ncbi:hypothetical protein OYG07_02480 [Actinobacillus pleuropneumoniae]|uniref:Uncharacterized protein n=2 Tax=Actinobacillus pleuropneumoniae TaxID=715 RepID=A0A3S5BLG4_ACTPL|nr:hypothetical protein [Actinobacillus pleuropneumoniae]ACE61117.1 hypothetical protein APP7_0465 [Actinobacillus pleuropneumoniae serovar 7 str. AP76]MCL7721940.1 hypothetical protein [Actinobacillus pleuropneumoniae]MCL7726842.1 hypothetical protein [Actinobacillus pleuropneumoniae]MCL7730340.1 hypothetical protein [Actinobacillus pleuropneumoniae]MCY6367413.1 hypothetical protein [Actinobacillus pleuropneumoniae]
MKNKRYKRPNKSQIREYKAYLDAVKTMYEDMPDGAYFAILIDSTESWLNENNLGHLDAHDFYHQYG